MRQAPCATCATPSVGKRIVIAGGGYAGTTAAVNLGRKLKGRSDVEIMLIEPNAHQQALSELDLVAVGPARAEFCELWHARVFKNLPVTVCYNRVTSVNPASHSVTVGSHGVTTGEVDYWRLVLATGAVAFVPPVPGLAEHAVTMWSVADAQELQRRGEVQFRVAAKLDPIDRPRALSFTVIGGGATGIEIVGTLAELLPKRIRTFGLDRSDLRIRLVEGRPDILYDLPQQLRERTKRHLAKLGVELITGSMVSRVERDTVHLENGSVIDSSVLVFCGGAKAEPSALEWGLEVDASGRLVVSEVCKAPGYDDIYVVGDISAFRDTETGRTIPMLAQFAIREAEHTAKNILRELRCEQPTPFPSGMHGEFVSAGPSWGIGWMFGLNLSGIPAIIMKRLTYVLYWLQVGGIPLAVRRTREMLKMQR